MTSTPPARLGNNHVNIDKRAARTQLVDFLNNNLTQGWTPLEDLSPLLEKEFGTKSIQTIIGSTTTKFFEMYSDDFELQRSKGGAQFLVRQAESFQSKNFRAVKDIVRGKIREAYALGDTNKLTVREVLKFARSHAGSDLSDTEIDNLIKMMKDTMKTLNNERQDNLRTLLHAFPYGVQVDKIPVYYKQMFGRPLRWNSSAPQLPPTAERQNNCVYTRSWSQRPTVAPEVRDSLDEAISKYVVKAEITEGVEYKRQEMKQNLLKAVTNHFPGAELDLHGSTAMGLDTCSSDLDLAIRFDESLADDDVSYILERFAECIDQNLFDEVEVITGARVPIVKLVYKGIECDLKVSYGEHDVTKTRLVKSYMERDARVRKLGMAVKHWAKARAILGARDGMPNSFAYTLMVIHFLQVTSPPILPCLSPEDPECHTLDSGENTDNVGACLVMFWDFYHNFDFGKMAASVSHGMPIAKSQVNIGDGRDVMVVLDPLDRTDNTCRNVGTRSARVIKRELKRAYEEALGGCSWLELCTAVCRQTVHRWLPKSVIGRLMGHRGSNIERIRDRSGCYINVDDDDQNDYEQLCLTIQGTEQEIAKACKLIENATGETLAEAPLEPTETHRGWLPRQAMGRLLGPKGRNIQQIRERSNARVKATEQVMNNFPQVLIQITGTDEEIISAQEEVEKLVGRKICTEPLRSDGDRKARESGYGKFNRYDEGYDDPIDTDL